MFDFTNLFAAMNADYIRWTTSDGKKPLDEIRSRMAKEYADSLSFTEGKKYIRIVKGDSVWGFVVNVHDDPKFKYGDILKAAGWATPAKNKARGNMANTDLSWVKWTSAS